MTAYDPLSDPMFLTLLTLCGIAIAMVVYYGLARASGESQQRPYRPGNAPTPPRQQAMAPTFIPPATYYQSIQTMREPPRQRPVEAEQILEGSLRAFLTKLRILPGEKVCYKCGARLVDANGNLHVWPRSSFVGRGDVVSEVICSNCGYVLWQWPKEDRSSVELESKARQFPRLERLSIKSWRDLEEESRDAPPPPQQPQPTPSPQQPTQTPAPAPVNEPPAPAAPAPQALPGVVQHDWATKLSVDELGKIIHTCAVCPHYDHANKLCTKPEFSNRREKIYPSTKMCSWWSGQRFAKYLQTGIFEIVPPPRNLEATERETRPPPKGRVKVKQLFEDEEDVRFGDEEE